MKAVSAIKRADDPVGETGMSPDNASVMGEGRSDTMRPTEEGVATSADLGLRGPTHTWGRQTDLEG